MHPIIAHNVSWMMYNSLLAVIPVLLGWYLYSAKSKGVQGVLFVVWLLFLPNTVYIFTDIIHFFRHIRLVPFPETIFLMLQYIVFFVVGLLTFIVALYPFERLLRKGKNNRKSWHAGIIIGLNFLVGLGIVLGRVHRLNSWDFVVEIDTVISSIIETLTTPHLLLLVLLFGIFSNFTYFLFKDQIAKYTLKNI
jgi:uncharacterized membrane protein